MAKTPKVEESQETSEEATSAPDPLQEKRNAGFHRPAFHGSNVNYLACSKCDASL